nr:probable basic-leucine zipper transcription factor R [Ipomoea batatas]
MFSHHFAPFIPTLHKMEDQCSLLSWPYFFQEEEIELKQSLLYTTLELENTLLCAQDELAKKDEEILQLKNLLGRFVKERDEAVAKCRRLGVEKLLLHRQLRRPENIAGGESGPTTTNEDQENALSNSEDSEENVLPVAVMEAGPLLQTLLLAGPLPQWQHPPPHLNSVDIPPVTISSAAAVSKKRAGEPLSPSASSPKYQKVVNQSSLVCLIT